MKLYEEDKKLIGWNKETLIKDHSTAKIFIDNSLGTENDHVKRIQLCSKIHALKEFTIKKIKLQLSSFDLGKGREEKIKIRYTYVNSNKLIVGSACSDFGFLSNSDKFPVFTNDFNAPDYLQKEELNPLNYFKFAENDHSIVPTEVEVSVSCNKDGCESEEFFNEMMNGVGTLGLLLEISLPSPWKLGKLSFVESQKILFRVEKTDYVTFTLFLGSLYLMFLNNQIMTKFHENTSTFFKILSVIAICGIASNTLLYRIFDLGFGALLNKDINVQYSFRSWSFVVKKLIESIWSWLVLLIPFEITQLIRGEHHLKNKFAFFFLIFGFSFQTLITITCSEEASQTLISEVFWWPPFFFAVRYFCNFIDILKGKQVLNNYGLISFCVTFISLIFHSLNEFTLNYDPQTIIRVQELKGLYSILLIISLMIINFPDSQHSEHNDDQDTSINKLETL